MIRITAIDVFCVYAAIRPVRRQAPVLPSFEVTGLMWIRGLILMSFQLVRRSETMKGIFLSAAMMVLTVAAAEAAVGLALVIALYRLKQTVHLDALNQLEG